GLKLTVPPSIWPASCLATSSQRSARAGEAEKAASASAAASRTGRRNCRRDVICECPLGPLKLAAELPARARFKCQSEADDGDGDRECDHADHTHEGGNAGQHPGKPEPLAASRQRDGEGAH